MGLKYRIQITGEIGVVATNQEGADGGREKRRLWSHCHLRDTEGLVREKSRSGLEVKA